MRSVALAMMALSALLRPAAAQTELPPIPGVAPPNLGTGSGATPTLIPMRTMTERGSVAQRAGQPIALEAGSGRILQLGRAAASVFAADPRVLEVRPASPTSLFIFGVAPGRTTIAALDSSGAPVAQYEITVRPSAYGAGEAQATINRLIPGGRIRAETRGNGIALSGEANSAADADRAVAIAQGYVTEGQVVDNRLTVLGQVQVSLRVRIAEVSREVTRQLGVDWQSIGTVGRFAVSLATPNAIADALAPSSRLALGFSSGSTDINAFIDALAQDRLINVLAEPNLTSMSGQTASFLVGGEFPIPVALRDNVVSVQFRQYGVSLAFIPTVLSQGRISLRVRPEVSELSDQGAVRLTAGNSSIQIPALTVRRAETTVELGSGQSFAIAGLLQDSSRNLSRAVPVLGEIPILGPLFRSNRYQRNETELVIIITPYIVSPVGDPVALRAPTDRFLQPTESERLVQGRQQGRPRVAGSRPPGQAGYVLD
ncbi:type II and III secretion system protein family protein [Muricoccus radiodurans]|uniref:type II and III secretion system protein family protein n=1 Tax=Muricoccus radiodurans TaxID=2231721 RepID=UPI003CF33071